MYKYVGYSTEIEEIGRDSTKQIKLLIKEDINVQRLKIDSNIDLSKIELEIENYLSNVKIVDITENNNKIIFKTPLSLKSGETLILNISNEEVETAYIQILFEGYNPNYTINESKYTKPTWIKMFNIDVDANSETYELYTFVNDTIVEQLSIRGDADSILFRIEDQDGKMIWGRKTKSSLLNDDLYENINSYTKTGMFFKRNQQIKFEIKNIDTGVTKSLRVFLIGKNINEHNKRFTK